MWKKQWSIYFSEEHLLIHLTINHQNLIVTNFKQFESDLVERYNSDLPSWVCKYGNVWGLEQQPKLSVVLPLSLFHLQHCVKNMSFSIFVNNPLTSEIVTANNCWKLKVIQKARVGVYIRLYKKYVKFILLLQMKVL